MSEHPLKIQIAERQSLGIHAVAALRDAALKIQPETAAEQLVLAERIRRCNDPSNTWTAEDLHTADGELYDGAGRFWYCCSKFCAACLARETRRQRKNIEAALHEQKLKSGESFKFITLTMTTPQTNLPNTRHLIWKAWTLFRKRRWFKQTFVGGVRCEEFTLGRLGYHYHHHIIGRTRYINYHKFRSEWTECLASAFSEAGLPFSPATSDKMAIANVRNISSFKEATREVCKYITKSDSWSKMDAASLCELAAIRRFPRMVEFFGTFRNAKRLEGGPVVEADDCSDIGVSDATPILDNESISDGQQSWRAKVKRLGAVQYLARLDDEMQERFEFRVEQLKHHFPYARFWRSSTTNKLTIEQFEQLLELARPNSLPIFDVTPTLADLDNRAIRLHA